MSSDGKRLNKFISESGFCSRRGADKLIEENRVTINGKHPELGTKVQAGDEVRVNGKLINASPENKQDRIYIAYNKPIGITCTTEKHVRGNIIDAIGHKERIFPIGRLDKPSEGLIFLTSDGDIVNKILRAENAHDKEYLVTVDRPISERFIERMSKGVPILGTITKPCVVQVKSKFVFTIILTQGLNRQIRRMCEYLGYEVTKLKRSRIMNVELGRLKVGEWRNLSSDEMNEINEAVKYSQKTADASSESGNNLVEPEDILESEPKPANKYKEIDKVADISETEKNDEVTDSFDPWASTIAASNAKKAKAAETSNPVEPVTNKLSVSSEVKCESDTTPTSKLHFPKAKQKAHSAEKISAKNKQYNVNNQKKTLGKSPSDQKGRSVLKLKK